MHLAQQPDEYYRSQTTNIKIIVLPSKNLSNKGVQEVPQGTQLFETFPAEEPQLIIKGRLESGHNSINSIRSN